MLTLLVAVLCSVAAFLVGWFVQVASAKKKIGTAEDRAKQILEAAEREANTIKK